MSVQEILEIEPDDVGFYIKEETGDVPLSGTELRALFNVLAEKKIPKRVRNHALQDKML